MSVRFIDSHTEGEPTRLILDAPELAGSTVAEMAENLDPKWCRKVLCEPRGHEAIVGAVLLPPDDPSHDYGLLFFNNAGRLRMCGHGTIGVAATLAFMGKAKPGVLRFSTPVGEVKAHLHDDRRTVTIQNVPSYRVEKDVKVSIPGHPPVTGDISFGGNYFFLTYDLPTFITQQTPDKPANLDFKSLDLEIINENANFVETQVALTSNNLTPLSEFAQKILDEIQKTHPEVDHVELMGAPTRSDCNARNFVLCPGGEFDRSPCGTGTSAKLACLATDGHLKEGETWGQESIIGSRFEGRFEWFNDKIIPSITGPAYVTAQGGLIFDEMDPFKDGIQFKTFGP